MFFDLFRLPDGKVEAATLVRNLVMFFDLFRLPDGKVEAATSVRNLGMFFDQSLMMNDHVSRLVRARLFNFGD